MYRYSVSLSMGASGAPCCDGLRANFSKLATDATAARGQYAYQVPVSTLHCLVVASREADDANVRLAKPTAPIAKTVDRRRQLPVETFARLRWISIENGMAIGRLGPAGPT
jgi:hypothetical protein